VVLNDELPKRDSDVITFGELVCERRKARGWSQESLAAEALGNLVRKGYVSAVENGKFRNITPENVKKFARALQIDRKLIPVSHDGRARHDGDRFSLGPEAHLASQ